jgi:heme oxygenase
MDDHLTVIDPMLELRNGTQDLHNRIEASPYFSVLMKEHVTIADYVHVLDLLSRFYADCEAQLYFGISHYFPDLKYIPRLPLLNQDLRKLGIIKNDEPIENITSAPNKAYILGVLYVVEGSTLGGQIISRHLQERLGSRISDAMRFYTLDGKMLPDHWSNVKRLFRENLNDSEEIAQTVCSARAAFNSLLS